MQFVYDYPLTAALSCLSILLMLGVTWKVRLWKDRLPYLAVSWIILFGLLIAGTYSVNHVVYVAKKGLRDNLSGLAKSFAIALKDAGHEKITFETSDSDPLYWKMIAMMSEWQKQIPVAASIYTFRKNDEGEIVFICCPPADLNRDGIFEGEREERVPIGTIYDEDEEYISEILDAFAGRSGFSDAPVEDDWGLWITAAEPIFDETGEYVDAVLGVDFWGEDWNTYIQNAVFWTELFLLLSVVLFFAVQVFTIRRHIVEDRLTEYAAELERTMDELVEAKKHADSAVQAKSFFLANISHEIRTPMSAILGCVDMLVGVREGKSGTFTQEQLVDIIQKSSKNLMTIIDDVLTYSSIDTHRIVLESAPIDLRQVVEDVKIMTSSHFEKKPHLKFYTEWDDSVPNVIIGDPARIRQILLALISNAVKFTESGHITVRCSSILFSEEMEYTGTMCSAQPSSHPTPFLSPGIAQAKGLRGIVPVVSAEQAELLTTIGLSQTLEVWKASPTALLLRIDVSDTGIGIAKEQFGALFKSFTQVDNTSTRKFGGVGLGLSIVKGLVQLMGGDVQIASKLGQGSTFSVFLPVRGHEDSILRHKQQHDSQVLLQQGLPPLHDYRVLLADDVVVNRIVVETRLRDMGAEVQNVSDGKVAIDCVLAAEGSEAPFDFILMDLQMPVMDGFEAARTLRQRGFTKPIVAFSANRNSEKEAIEAGYNLVLVKPVDQEALHGAIVSLVKKTNDKC